MNPSTLFAEVFKQFKCLNTWMDSSLPVQEGFSIMTSKTEQETMEQNLL